MPLSLFKIDFGAVRPAGSVNDVDASPARAVRIPLCATLLLSSLFFFFIYPSLSLACIRIEVSNVRYSNYHRCSVVLGFVIIVNRCVLLIIEKCCVIFPFSIVHKSEARVMAIRLNKWRIFIMEENCTRHRYRKATDKSAARSHKYSLVKRINTSNEP